MKYTIEIIAFNLESCILIEKSGAHRIELCAGPDEGGTTPSYGMIKAARESVSISLFPIIRPRGGDFLYSDAEFTLMKDDVQLCKQLGCDGVVLGLLQRDGSIDLKRTAKLVELAYPMAVTFHRAFDHCKHPFIALEQLIQIGCQRILTSGQKRLATDGAELIAALIKEAADRIIIMPGSGVRPGNIKLLAQTTGAVEFHSSLRTKAKLAMAFHQPAFAGEVNASSYATTDAVALQQLLQELSN